MKYIILLIVSFTLLTCSKSTTNPDIHCSTVINAQGPGYLKVINTTNTKVLVFLPDYAFGAQLNVNHCEMYGMGTGMNKAEISICNDDDCNKLSNTKKISFRIEYGEIYQVDVDGDFF